MTSARRRSTVERVAVERLGGFAGFGGPGGALRSRGSVDIAALSAADRAAVEAAFAAAAHAGDATGNTGTADAFRYRLTRTGADGTAQTVELPEAAVPAILRASVRDTLE